MKPLKVFYIDDEEDLLEIFQEEFSEESIKVTTFSDAVEGLKRIQEDKPDVVFLDYRMPKMTGDEIAQKINPDLPKALITGEIELETNTKFDHIFSKPYEFDEIMNFIKKVRDKKIN